MLVFGAVRLAGDCRSWCPGHFVDEGIEFGTTADGATVTASADAHVDLIFAPALPGVTTRRTVSAVSALVVEQDPDLPQLEQLEAC